MIARQLLDLRLLIFRYAGNDQVLIRRNAEFAFVDLRDLQQAGFQRTPRIIKNTTIFNKQRQVPVIVDTLHPADTIAAAGELVRTDRLKLDARPTLHFRLKGLNPYAFEGVFGFRVLRSVRLPQSRWVVTTASATAVVCSTGR